MLLSNMFSLNHVLVVLLMVLLAKKKNVCQGLSALNAISQATCRLSVRSRTDGRPPSESGASCTCRDEASAFGGSTCSPWRGAMTELPADSTRMLSGRMEDIFKELPLLQGTESRFGPCLFLKPCSSNSSKRQSFLET